MTSAVGFTKPLVGGGNSVPQGRRRRWWSMWRSTLRESIKIYALYYTPKKIRPVLYAVFSKNAFWAYILAKNRAYIWPKTGRISGQTQPATCPPFDAVHRPPSRRSGRRDLTWACPWLLRDAWLPAVGHLPSVACGGGGGGKTGSSYICPLTCFSCYNSAARMQEIPSAHAQWRIGHRPRCGMCSRRRVRCCWVRCWVRCRPAISVGHQG
jgi:hypothetical protein